MQFSRYALGAVALAAATMLSATASSANPASGLTPLKQIGAEQSTVEQAHFWHRTCRRGANGWPRHVPGVGRIQCTTHKCWKNRWGGRSCAWY